MISSVAWLILAFRPTIWGAVLSLFVLALGEIIQQPRYYEYISRLAPRGQQGTYMGFAFLPLGIGSLIAGWLGGRLLYHFGEVMHQPGRMWWARLVDQLHLPPSRCDLRIPVPPPSGNHFQAETKCRAMWGR